MLVVTEQAAIWTGTIDEFALHALRESRDAMRYARKKEIRLKRRDVGTLWLHLEAPEDVSPEEALERLAAMIAMCEVLRLDGAVFGESGEEQLRRRELAAALGGAVGALDAEKRALVGAYYDDGVMLREWAAKKGWSYTSAKRYHREALVQMHGFLVQRGHDYGKGRTAEVG